MKKGVSAMSAIGAYGSYGSMSGYYSIYQNRNANRNAGPNSMEPVGAVSRAQTAPVPPVSQVPAVQRGAAQAAPEEESRFQFPTMREGADPAEMAVRARIQYLDGELADKENELLYWDQSKGLEKLLEGKEAQDNGVKLPWEQKSVKPVGQEDEEAKTPQEVVEDAECQTCKNRK